MAPNQQKYLGLPMLQFCFFNREPKPPVAQIAQPPNPCCRRVLALEIGFLNRAFMSTPKAPANEIAGDKERRLDNRRSRPGGPHHGVSSRAGKEADLTVLRT